MKKLSTTEDTEDTEENTYPETNSPCPLCPLWWRVSDHFTSLSGIIATGAGGSDDSSTVPLTGGRSWNMKSHFQRSDGLLASSQWRPSIGVPNVSAVMPANSGAPAKRTAMSARTAAALV